MFLCLPFSVLSKLPIKDDFPPILIFPSLHQSLGQTAAAHMLLPLIMKLLYCLSFLIGTPLGSVFPVNPDRVKLIPLNSSGPYQISSAKSEKPLKNPNNLVAL